MAAEEAEPPRELFLARLPSTPFEVTLRDLIVRLGDYEFGVFHNCERGTFWSLLSTINTRLDDSR